MYRNTLTTITAIFTLTLNLVFTQVVINEIHFNPGSAQGSDALYEFLELHNPGTTDIDISGYSFTEGINHVFADATTLAAGAYLVLAKNSDSYVGSIQWGSGSLTNGTEDIEIINAGVDGNSDGDLDDLGVDNNGDGDFDDAGVDNNGDGDFDDAGGDANGDGDFDDAGDTLPDVAADVAPVDTAPTVVDYVDYEFGDYGEIHGAADGGGGSLELLDAASDNSLAASWQVSWVVGGSPGAMSSSEPTATVLTIYNIQNPGTTGEDSPYLDEYIQTTGIVTGIDRIGTNSAFTIQDGSGSWNGIYCWWGADAEVVLGDEVTVRGTVVEYTAGGGDTLRSMTQLTGGYIASINSSGNALPAAVVLDIEDVGDEQYEGVLVTTSGKVVAAVNEDSYGEWRISNNLDASDMDADTINVNDRFAETDPAFGTIATVTGPLNDWSGSGNSSSSWRIEPATEADVVVACENSDLTINVLMLDSFGDGWNGGYYEIRGPAGTLEGTGGLEAGWSAVDTYCLSVGNFFIYVIAENYPSEISFNVTDAFGNALITGGMPNSGPFDYPFSVTGINETTGCTDPTAVNYEYTAAVDDGSCYYYGDICESPLVMSGGSGVAASDADQYFAYTAIATGNMTVSSVGQTQEDTYLVILGSCAMGTEYDIDEITGDTLYVSHYYEDLLATNDDADYGTGVYQSEATICVAAGETYLIGWISMYYPYEETFNFSVTESADITTPVNMAAYGNEDGIEVSWSTIPIGCAEAAEAAPRSSTNSFGGLQFKTKPGTERFILTPGKKRDMSYRNNSSRDVAPTPSLTRDCEADHSEITFEIVGGSYPSERTYEVVDASFNIVASGTNGPDVVCLPNGLYTVYGDDSWGDGWGSGALFTVTYPGGVIAELDVVPSGSSGSAEFEIDIDYSVVVVYGCMDATALNYDPEATEDNGSCYWAGDICTAPIATGTAGVTAGAAGWYSVDIPAAAGFLTVTQQTSDYIYVVSDCDYSFSWPDYMGLIGYTYSDSTVVVFGAGGTTYGGDPTDVYLGATVLVYTTTGDVSFSYTEYVYGCTDPNASNHDPLATMDDGSCECGGTSVVMTMYDAWGDGWNGNTYAIVDASDAIVASGTIVTGSLAVDEICLPGDGVYSVFVGVEPAISGSYQSEVSWELTAVENGQTILAGGAPFGGAGGNTFPIPLPEYTFALYRNNVMIEDALVGASYYDSLSVAGAANLMPDTDYCYTATQTI